MFTAYRQKRLQPCSRAGTQSFPAKCTAYHACTYTAVHFIACFANRRATPAHQWLAIESRSAGDLPSVLLFTPAPVMSFFTSAGALHKPITAGYHGQNTAMHSSAA
jgi:hypothetical protein